MEQEIIEAVDTAVLAAAMGLTTPMTAENLGLVFTDNDHVLLRQLLLERFDTITSVEPEEATICVGRVDHDHVYLLAQVSRAGQIVYLISPSPELEE